MRIELQQVSLCAGCGNCCRSIGLPPFEVPNPDLGPQPVVPTLGGCFTCQQVRDTDTFAAMPAALRAEHARLVRELKSDPSGEPCAWLNVETGACRHYEYRPAVCHDFPVGQFECTALRTGIPQCVWISDATPEKWRNPRAKSRYLPKPPSRWRRFRKWLRRNVLDVTGEMFVEGSGMRIERCVYVRFLPRYEVRLRLWGVRFRRRRLAGSPPA